MLSLLDLVGFHEGKVTPHPSTLSLLCSTHVYNEPLTGSKGSKTSMGSMLTLPGALGMVETCLSESLKPTAPCPVSWQKQKQLE